MARVALLCWEIGDGLGHVSGLWQVSRALKARGWSCVFALPKDQAVVRMLPRGTDVRMAPEWGRGAPPGFVRTGSSASMVDMLADIGLRSADWTRAQIIGWHLVFAEMLPDLVIADHGPGALLAARGRIPAVAVGTGYAVPPAGLERFPPLHQLAAIRDDEDAIRNTANSVLAQFGNPPLTHLSDALTGDAALACTLPLLDPYARKRTEPVLGPLLGARVPAREGQSDTIVCYFQPGKFRYRLKKLADCLRDLPIPCRLFVPSLSPGEKKLLADGGVEVADANLGAQTLARAKLLVHAGGHGMACAAILAGVPQVVLSYDVEKELTGGALAAAGIARRLSFDLAPVSDIREAIIAAASDPGMDAAAGKTAEENAAYLNLDAAERVAERCEQLVA